MRSVIQLLEYPIPLSPVLLSASQKFRQLPANTLHCAVQPTPHLDALGFHLASTVVSDDDYDDLDAAEFSPFLAGGST